MVALAKSLSASLQPLIVLGLLVAVTLSVVSDGDLDSVFGNKVLVFVAFVALLQVCLAFVAACCLHCFHCRFALALDTVVWTCLVVRESHSLSLAQCELCMLHVPHLCASPTLQNQVYFPSMNVLVSCLRRVRNLRIPNWVAGL